MPYQRRWRQRSLLLLRRLPGRLTRPLLHDRLPLLRGALTVILVARVMVIVAAAVGDVAAAAAAVTSSGGGVSRGVARQDIQRFSRISCLRYDGYSNRRWPL